jgi:transcription initiation factor TFIID subunit 2
LKRIKKSYAADTKTFSDYWIYSTGVPRIEASFTYDMARSVVDIKVKQILPYPDAKRFSGSITVRVHENEGTYDYLIPIEKEEDHCEFACKSKARKKQKKKMAEEGHQNADTKTRIEIPLKWIRLDPELEWVRVLKFSQKASMWTNQLEKDRDVVAQLDAIEAMVNFSTKNDMAIAKLASIVGDKYVL